MKAIWTVAILAGIGFGCGNGPEQTTQQSQLWCGSKLCEWDLDEGEIEKVATWTEDEIGVALVTAGTTISRFIPSKHLDCIQIEFTAQLANDGDAVVEIDYYDDKIVDEEIAVTKAAWERLSYKLAMPPAYNGLRVRIRKRSDSKVALAFPTVAPLADQDCGVNSVSLTHRPVGALCTSNEECAQGFCTPGPWWSEFAERKACGECVRNSDCPEEQICDFALDAPPHLEVYRECGAPKRQVLGQPCVNHEACASGECCHGVCSTCCSHGDCTDRCERGERTPEMGPFVEVAFQCNTPAPPGSPCLVAADCESDRCVGSVSLRVCERDGKTCLTDDDCASHPFALKSGDSRKNGVDTNTEDTSTPEDKCRPVGIHGGVCQ